MVRAAIVSGLALAVIAAVPAQANDVTPQCKLNNITTVDCSTWHSGNITLRWTWDPSNPTNTSGCDVKTFSTDTPPSGTSVTCTVTWDTVFAGSTATVRVDKTGPAVTSATPARPPDYGGWYNHPVAFSFAGTDALSGISSCDTVQFAGPDGAATVSGGCRDIAGNRAVASFPLQYDSTPPAPAQVDAQPENGSIKLSWVAPSDAANVVVVRSAQAAATSKTVYRGTGRDVTDRGLRNGVRYRYTVTVLDQAGNASSTDASAVPTASSLRPVNGTAVSTPPRLTWKTVKRATYYNVQLFKGRHKVLSAWPHGSHLQLRAKWRYRGHHVRLAKGKYRWYVWPGFGARQAERYGKLIGHSSFRLSG